MTQESIGLAPDVGGIALRNDDAQELEAAGGRLRERLGALGLAPLVEDGSDAGALRFRLRAAAAAHLAPGYDTIGLCGRLGLDTEASHDDLEREILLAMLAGPVAFTYPSHQELAAAVRIRRNIVAAARRTALTFDTAQAERPSDYWTYAKERGFTVLPGKPLIEALRRATQPEVSGTRYSFSCYRATEYVILLAVAEELEVGNPALLERLQRQWETRAIASGQFHDVFLHEYGSMEAPLPPRYYVPGDRLWFRNPDAASSDVSGYEGSWVFYHGNGLFTNFWKAGQPYTFTTKCVEIYHWRNATCRNAAGELQIDETVVEARMRATLDDAAETAALLERMMRLRDPRGGYASGGCIETSREYPRHVCPGTADLRLPAQ